MSASDNKTATQAAYQAFANADLNGAMQDMADDIEWIVPGNSTISRTYRGKDEVRQLFVTLAGKSFRTEPEHFVADGDHVVVLTRVTADGPRGQDREVSGRRRHCPAGEDLGQQVAASQEVADDGDPYCTWRRGRSGARVSASCGRGRKVRQRSMPCRRYRPGSRVRRSLSPCTRYVRVKVGTRVCSAPAVSPSGTRRT